MITLLTDFGQSEYVGVMKGVIYSMYPQAIVCDLYHSLSPQYIKEGAWILLQNYKYFPKGTIFVCVVDPGVGSERNALLIKTKNYFFIGPDNGLMYPAAIEDGIEKVIILSTQGVSMTFHGRDVFAKAAGMFEKDKQLEKLGKPGKIEHELGFYLKERTGEIVRIDHFGNIITNLPSLHKKKYVVTYKNKKLELPFYTTYASAPENQLFLITGSCTTLEISLKNGSALKKLKISCGDTITIF